MPDTNTFNTDPGVTVARELLVSYLNVGTKTTPDWFPVGKRVEDSSIEMDWSTETKVDIFGKTYTTGKKATKTQTFDPCELDAEDKAQQNIWTKAIKENDVNKLLNMDMLIVHSYVGTNGSFFAERYESCAVLPTGLGGEGGGSVGMPIDVTYGGTRTTGTAAVGTDGKITFTPDTAAASVALNDEEL